MAQILIVDDEPLIRQWLMMCLEISGISRDHLHQASNGEEALQSIQENMYDLIFTDITMPKLDGIELIKSIRAYDPTVKIIILTCHDNFDFARTALKYNVYDYLLKDELTQESITKIISDTLIIPDAYDLQNQKNYLQTFANYNTADTVPFSDLVQNNISLDETFCFSFAIDCQDPSFFYHLTKNNDIQNIIHFDNGNHLTIFLCNLTCDISKYEKVLKYIEHSLLRQYNLEKHIGASQLYESPIYLPRMISEAILSWEKRFFWGPDFNIISPREAYASASKTFKQEITSAKESIILLFSGQNISALCKMIEDLCNCFIQNQYYDSTLFKRTFIGILESIDNKMDSHEELSREINTVNKATYLSDLLTSFYNYLDNIPTKQNLTECIKNAQKYIILHYNEPLTLSELAKQAYLNEEYFSRLFKKETGKTFTEYLLEVRMQRAQNLLKNSELNISEIAELVGIPNPSYFSSQFKKYFGVTPKQIR